MVEIDTQVPVPILGRHQVLASKSARGGLGTGHAIMMAMRTVMSDNMAFWFVVIVRMGMRVNVCKRMR